MMEGNTAYGTVNENRDHNTLGRLPTTEGEMNDQ